MMAGLQLLIIAVLCLYAAARGPICLNCLAVRHPKECRAVTECKSTEACFAEHFLYEDKLPAFSFGCRKIQDCQNGGSKRFGLKFCQSCCNDGDLCNNNICTNGTMLPTGIPCLDCADVSVTEHCYDLKYCQEGEGYVAQSVGVTLSSQSGICSTYSTVECTDRMAQYLPKPDQVCYAEQSSNPHDLKFTFGCLKKPICSIFTAEIIGKRRSATEFTPCHVCCETPGCNYEGCSDRHQMTTTPAPMTTTPAPIKAKDCWDLKTLYQISEDGVYEVLTPDGHKRTIRCDMTTDGGGWTVFQRRGNGSVDFYQHYEAYRMGFGNLSGEFWMGNDFLYNFTHESDQTLRVDICDWNGDTKWAKYGEFSVGPASDRYRLIVSTYSGTAGDALIKGIGSNEYHNGTYFSTDDADNDGYDGYCAKIYSGGWWFNACFTANLNGVYNLESSSDATLSGIQWRTWIDQHSFKGTQMKMRPSAATASTNEPFTCPVI